MKCKSVTIALGALLLAAPQFATAADPAVIATEKVVVKENDASMLVRSAMESIDKFVDDKGRKIPESALQRAQCVAVFPNVKAAALVVGGSHGDGIAACRGPKGEWSQIAFLDLASASFGAQIGAKATDLVLLFMNSKAKDKLASGTLTLGADLSATMGSLDKGFSVDTDKSDIIAYSKDSGLFAGAALTGTMIHADERSLQAFYSQPTYTISRTLTTYVLPSEPNAARDFVAKLPAPSSTTTAQNK